MSPKKYENNTKSKRKYDLFSKIKKKVNDNMICLQKKTKINSGASGIEFGHTIWKRCNALLVLIVPRILETYTWPYIFSVRYDMGIT